VEESRRDVDPNLREPVIGSVTDKIKHNINVSRKLLKNVTTPAQRAAQTPNSSSSRTTRISTSTS
jgi:hypothetical protein